MSRNAGFQPPSSEISTIPTPELVSTKIIDHGTFLQESLAWRDLAEFTFRGPKSRFLLRVSNFWLAKVPCGIFGSTPSSLEIGGRFQLKQDGRFATARSSLSFGITEVGWLSCIL